LRRNKVSSVHDNVLDYLGA